MSDRIVALAANLAALQHSSQVTFEKLVAAREVDVAVAFHTSAKKRIAFDLVVSTSAGVTIAPFDRAGPPVVYEMACRSGALFTGSVAFNYLRLRAQNPRLAALDILHAHVIHVSLDTALTVQGSAWIGLAMSELRQVTLDAQLDLDVALQRFSGMPLARKAKPNGLTLFWLVRAAAMGFSRLQRLRSVLSEQIHRLASVIEAQPALHKNAFTPPDSLLTRASQAYRVLTGEVKAVQKTLASASPSSPPSPAVQHTNAL